MEVRGSSPTGERRRRQAIAAAGAVLVALAVPGMAQAASRARETPLAKRVTAINLRLFNQVAAIPDATVRGDIASVEAKLACISDVVSALKGQTADVGRPIGEELGFAYAVGALETEYSLVGTAASQIAVMPFSSPNALKFKSNAMTVQSFVAKALGVDACADFQAWKAAGFMPSTEPPTTARIAELIASQNPFVSIQRAVVRVTPTHFRQLTRATSRARARDQAMVALVQSSLKQFFAAAGIPVH